MLRSWIFFSPWNGDSASSQALSVGDDSEPQATLTDIYQLSKHVSCISPTFVMIDQVSGRTKTVTLAHFVAQEGGQSYLHLRRVSAQRAAGAFHTLQNESFETVVDKFPGPIVVCDYAPGRLGW